MRTPHDGTPRRAQVYTGLLWFNRITLEKLLELHSKPPLDACTYLGIDSGAPPLALELHQDILAPLCAATVQAEYMAAQASSARAILWASLRGTAEPRPLEASLRLCAVTGGDYLYLGSPHDLRRLLLKPPDLLCPVAPPSGSAPDAALTATHVEGGASCEAGAACTNSLLEDEARCDGASACPPALPFLALPPSSPALPDLHHPSTPCPLLSPKPHGPPPPRLSHRPVASACRIGRSLAAGR